MTDTLLALVPHYGLWLIGTVTFLSCLAVPVPSSLLMIAGGAFAAAGDLSLIGIVSAAFAGAIAGDQAGFALGKRASTLINRLEQSGPQRRALINRARDFAHQWGNIGVFLSRWLLSPLGPYVNFIGGASGLGWAGFSLWAATGELIWVSLYTGLGYIFSDQIQMIADLASNLSGFLAAGAVAFVLGRIVLRNAGSKQA